MKWLLIAVFVLGIVLRLQSFGKPPIDAHPMRQTDTESVAYFFATKDANILNPQASLIRPTFNKEGVFFLEFPAYQYGLSILYRLFGVGYGVTQLYNIALFSLAFFSLWGFAKALWGRHVALWSVFFFSFMPASLFFLGRAIHPDVFATAMFSCALYCYVRSQGKRRFVFLTLFFITLNASIATRPFIALFLPGIASLMYIRKARWYEYVLLPASLLLYGLWRVRQLFFPSTYSSWEHWVLTGQSELLKLSVLRQLIMKNVTGEVMGKFVSLLAFGGVITSLVRFKKENIFLFLCVITIPVYWYIVPSGNIFHQYYANIYLIPVAILAGLFANTVFHAVPKRFGIAISVAIVAVTLLNGVRTSSYFFLDRVSSEHQAIAKDIEKHVPADSRIVYLATQNSIPFSLVHRQGWMLGGAPVDVGATASEVIAQKQYGARYAVAGKGNTDLPKEELEKLEKASKKTVETHYIVVYRL